MTADAGAPINGVAFTIPDALGNRVIYPFCGLPVEPTPVDLSTALHANRFPKAPMGPAESQSRSTERHCRGVESAAQRAGRANPKSERAGGTK